MTDQVKIHQGDCRQILALYPDNYFHTCVTSPPYWGLRDYGLNPSVWGGDPSCQHDWSAGPLPPTKNARQGSTETRKWPAAVGQGKTEPGSFCSKCGAWLGVLGLEPTPDLYVTHILEIFREVRRVLRDDGTLWLNLGDCYFSTTKGTGGPTPKQKTNAGSFFKPRKFQAPEGVKPKDLVGMPWMVAFALRNDGWYLRCDIVWHKPNAMPESIRDRPTRAHEFVFLLSKNARYFYDAEAIKVPSASNHWPGIGPQHAKTRNRGEKYQPMAVQPKRNRRSVWSLNTEGFQGAHFAVMPKKLARLCILAGTSSRGCCPVCGAPWVRVVEKGPEGESRTTGWKPGCSCGKDPVPCRVLDPFAGSGTTGLVALELGRQAILIEAQPDYIKIINERLSTVRIELNL